ncbi:MAG TPA: hypothetical protein PLJ21_07655 [Pseudobdellovibrionaceae bacterium]|nr:hypothetical protein [Pseudobdellovibrionaceae bacterium]
MEKISKIVSLSPRMRSINVNRSQPARPGSVEYGRPPGKNSLSDQLVALGEKLAPINSENRFNIEDKFDVDRTRDPLQENPTYKRFTPQVKAVDDINDRFQGLASPEETQDLLES